VGRNYAAKAKWNPKRASKVMMFHFHPKLAHKLSFYLMLLNFSLGLGLVTIIIYLLLKEKKESLPELPPQPKPYTVSELTLAKLSPCWETRILENLPPPKPEPIQQKVVPAPVIELPIQLPFEWVGVAVHWQSSQSFCILINKQNNQQISVYEGELLPETEYKVIKIAIDKIHVQCKEKVVYIEKPKPWQTLYEPKKPPSRSGSIVSSEPNISIQRNKMIVGNNPEMAAYGLLSQDQILTVAGKRVYTLKQLEEVLQTIDKSSIEISVVRYGKIMSLIIPTKLLSQTIPSEKPK
jgi:hypothetical protein